MCVNSFNSCDLNKIAYLCKKESMTRNCDACGNEYQVKEANFKRGWGRTCSKSCACKIKMVTLGPIKAQRAADKHFQSAIKKFGGQVVFPEIAPQNIDEKITVFCEKHGNINVTLRNIADNKFACPDCGTKKIVVRDGQKQCSKCKEWKTLSEYSKSGKTSKNGEAFLAAHCKSCQAKKDNEKWGTEIRKQQLKQAQERYQIKNGIVPGKRFEYITVCSCEYCQKKFTTKGKKVKRFCSKECGKEFRRVNRVGKPLIMTAKKQTCKTCETVFIGTHPGRCKDCIKAAYKIAHKAHKKKRKAALKTVAIHAVVDAKVFARDKWKCCECKCKVQKKDIYADNAAELDHIVPVSLGGPHSYSNVQTLCRKCNANKSNKYNGQLVMCL